MKFDEALNAFKDEMKTKFWQRDGKHGNKSITRLDSSGAAQMEGLFEHFRSEVLELLDAPTDTSEMVDVANMCFAMWWRQKAVEEEP